MFGASIMSVLFPAMANINEMLDRVKNMTRKAVRIMSFIMFPLLFGLAAVAKPLVEFLFTDKWMMAVPYVRILSIAYAISLIGTVSLQAIKAVGRSDILLKLEVIKKPIYLLLLIVGMKTSVIGVAITMGIYNIYGAIVNAIALKCVINYDIKSQVYDWIHPLVLSSLMFILVYMVESFELNCLIILIIQVFLGILTYVGLSFITKQKALSEVLKLIKVKGGKI